MKGWVVWIRSKPGSGKLEFFNQGLKTWEILRETQYKLNKAVEQGSWDRDLDKAGYQRMSVILKVGQP